MAHGNHYELCTTSTLLIDSHTNDDDDIFMEIAPLITYSHSIDGHIAAVSFSLLLIVTSPPFLGYNDKSGDLWVRKLSAHMAS